MPIVPAMANNETSLTHDYSDISSLPSEYSYGTLFWTDSSEVINNNGNPYVVKADNSVWEAYGAREGEEINVKITNCAVDKDGGMCDVIIKVTDIQEMNGKTETGYDANFRVTNEDKHIRAIIEIGSFEGFLAVAKNETRPTSRNGLVGIWLDVSSATVHLSVQYVKTGTNTPANITKTIATVCDFDVQSNQPQDLWRANEGMTIDDAIGEVYYKKGNWLIDTEGEKGIRTPAYELTRPENVQPEGISLYNSAFITEDLGSNSTFKAFYGGYQCGIFYTFASPYPYELDKPIKTVDNTIAFEGDKLNYKVTQYIPSNYYVDELNFINNVRGKYTNLVIKDELNSNLKLEGDIKVTNESNQDVTSYFDITATNNIITATAKSGFLTNVNFYAHTYTLNIPVSIKSGAGENISAVTNIATTTATPGIDKTGTEIQTSNTVNTDLEFKIVVNAIIDHGKTRINSLVENQLTSYIVAAKSGESSNNTVYFTPATGYKVSKVTVDSEEISLDKCVLNNGTYSYTFEDTNINKDIIHNVVVNTELKDTSVIAKYVEENGKEIATSQTQTGKVFEDYETTAKTIVGYELKATPTNATGKMTEDVITVTYVYKLKDASVTAKYIDVETGKELADSETIKGKVFNNYTTTAKTFDEYNLTTTPVNSSGTMTEEPIEVIYYYSRKDSTVTANYIDEDGKQISKSEPKTGKIGDEYTTESKEIEGYELTAVPVNSSGKMTVEPTIVNYVYKLKDAKVIVKYVDTDGKEISDNTTINGKYFGEYDTSGKEIANYKIAKIPENSSGVMNKDEITVIYVYDLKSTSVTINYLDENGKQIADSETINGKVFDEYKTTSKEIEGYTLTIVPNNTKGTMTEEAIVVNYIYSKKITEVKVLPNTGNSRTFMWLGAASVALVVVMFIKNRKYKDI